MNTTPLTSGELVGLVRSVFPPRSGDRRLVLLVDYPAGPEQDRPRWTARRELAAEWGKILHREREKLGLEHVDRAGYAATGSNNADLPAAGVLLGETQPGSAAALESSGEAVELDALFNRTQIVIALTEFSATAPLKLAARVTGLRAATMPGFDERMLPALRIDYGQVHDRVLAIKTRLDRAEIADVVFEVDGGDRCELRFDLRYREAHASTGRFPEPGTAGNLPSGEAYIVPFEGRSGDPSRTRGLLPVQIGGEVVVYRVRENRAVAVESRGAQSRSEAQRLESEPAYGNMAELGFGVLAEFGLEPIGEILLDEKLGFHIAFGRSDHFGGQVGPADFSSPAAVIHLDRIYIPATQPRVRVAALQLSGEPGPLITDGRLLYSPGGP